VGALGQLVRHGVLQGRVLRPQHDLGHVPPVFARPPAAAVDAVRGRQVVVVGVVAPSPQKQPPANGEARITHNMCGMQTI